MNNMATIFQAEAKAIAVCAKEIEAKHIRGKKINIFSDSQAVIKSLTNNKITSKSIQECMEHVQVMPTK